MFKSALLVLALVGAVAPFSVTSPSADIWWVNDSMNTLAWTCSDSPVSQFTVTISNSNQAILAGSLALIAIEQNFECSKTITPQVTPATGYVINLANPLNSSDIYVSSAPFEIKAVGSTYPPQQTTSASGPSATGSNSTTGTSGKSGAVSVRSNVAAALSMGVVAFGMGLVA